MALPCPEGEVFFKRSVLKDNGHRLDPDNLKSFNKHALVEWCWNESYGKSYPHSPGKHQLGTHNSNEKFAYNEAMIIMFGTKEGSEKYVGRGNGETWHDSRHSDIKQIVRTNLLESEEYERRSNVGPLMTALTPIELHPNQSYMYIDLTFPIRAIYFPLAQKPSKIFPDLCSYLMVDFRLRQGVEMWDKPKLETEESKKPRELPPKAKMLKRQLDGHFRSALSKEELQREIDRVVEEDLKARRTYVHMDFDLHAGLGVHHDKMISLYIPGIYNYLIFPRQMHSVERGLYKPTNPFKSLIRCHPISAINTRSNFIIERMETVDQNHSLKLDMTKILEGHLGIQVVWQPFDIPEPKDANKMIIDIFEAGLCFVPMVGPLASTCFGLVMDIVNNAGAFKEINPFDLSGDILENIAERGRLLPMA